MSNQKNMKIRPSGPSKDWEEEKGWWKKPYSIINGTIYIHLPEKNYKLSYMYAESDGTDEVNVV